MYRGEGNAVFIIVVPDVTAMRTDDGRFRNSSIAMSAILKIGFTHNGEQLPDTRGGFELENYCLDFHIL